MPEDVDARDSDDVRVGSRRPVRRVEHAGGRGLDDLDDVIRVVDEFCYERSFMINVGDEKGETTDRLALVAAWWESQYFTPQEQAALALAEQVTRIGDLRSGRFHPPGCHLQCPRPK